MGLSDDARTLWEAACGLNRAAAAVMPAAARLPPLIFVTDPARTPEPWRIAARLPPGAGVIFRAFGASDALGQARRMREATRTAGVRLLIGQDADLAESAGADGLHLPQRDLRRASGLRQAHPGWLLTGAVHDEAAIAVAADGIFDALILSPVFRPGGRSVGEALGVSGFQRMAGTTATPVYALGGISARTVGLLADSRACGVCAVEGVIQAFA